MSGLQRLGIAAGVAVLLGGALWLSGAIRVSGPADTGDSGGAPADQSAGTPEAKTPAKAEPAEDLDALGYINSVPIKEGEQGRKGVVRRAEGVAGDGLFIVNPTWERRAGGPIREAFLWTMAGEQLHRWAPKNPDAGEKGWGGARLDDEGFLHVVADGALVKYDWAGNELWRHDARHHHDLGFDADGSPVVVSEQMRTVPGAEGVPEMKIKDHGLTFFSRTGEVQQELWLYDVLKDDPRMAEVLVETVRWKTKRFGKRVDWTRPSDVFHLNSLDVLPRDVLGLGKKGDVLVSPRRFDRIAVINRERASVEWIWGEGQLDHQHDPTLTHDDRVVVFDNGKHRKYSRAVVVDPTTRTLSREYKGLENKPFYSSGRGSVQALVDGSLFVVISNEARIVLVGPKDDALQWEFVSPWIQNNARLPIRGVYLEGPALDIARKIVDGSVPPPAAG